MQKEEKVVTLAENGSTNIRGTLAHYKQGDAIFATFFGDTFEGIQSLFFYRVCVFMDRQIQMSFITNKDERGTLFWLHPKLDIVQEACEYTRDNREYIRWYFGKVHYLNTVLAFTRGEQLCNLLREPSVPQRCLWWLEHKAITSVFSLSHKAGNESR